VKENGGSIVNGRRLGAAPGRLSATPPNFNAVHRAASACAPTVGAAACPGACIASHKIGSNNTTWPKS
jgi:hypothetical protein